MLTFHPLKYMISLDIKQKYRKTEHWKIKPVLQSALCTLSYSTSLRPCQQCLILLALLSKPLWMYFCSFFFQFIKKTVYLINSRLFEQFAKKLFDQLLTLTRLCDFIISTSLRFCQQCLILLAVHSKPSERIYFSSFFHPKERVYLISCIQYKNSLHYDH